MKRTKQCAHRNILVNIIDANLYSLHHLIITGESVRHAKERAEDKHRHFEQGA